jgi:hypothetical protein
VIVLGDSEEEEEDVGSSGSDDEDEEEYSEYSEGSDDGAGEALRGRKRERRELRKRREPFGRWEEEAVREERRGGDRSCADASVAVFVSQARARVASGPPPSRPRPPGRAPSLDRDPAAAARGARREGRGLERGAA